MWKIAIPKHAWLALCDGARGLILRNDGDAANLCLRTVAAYERSAASTHELGTDRPGRVTASLGFPRSAVESPDLHDRTEEEFVARFVHELDCHVRNDPHGRLIIAAPPRVLGRVRKILNPELRDRLFAEIPKDLTANTVAEIQGRLSA
ncbi:baeRF12 domain-containing protein [Bordetella genomosp. 11]|nr:host attachment family protein [Bordetella genomosp. 11]